MTDVLITPDELDPTNGNENNNLQSNSEENTQRESTDKKSPTHDPDMFKRILEEIDRKEAQEEQKAEVKPVPPTRDPSIWERKSEEDDTASAEGGEGNVEQVNEKDPDEDDELDIRDYKGSNKKLAGLIRVSDQKQMKYDRLVGEMKALKADLKRGYRIVEDKDGNKKQNELNSAEKLVISFKISDLDYERFMTRIEIQKLDQRIKKLANKKRAHRIVKKQKLAKSNQVDKLVERIFVALSNAAKNGKGALVESIRQQVRSGKKDDACKSLKVFLSKDVKPVAKKLDKDEKLEKIVLDKVIDKLSGSQS